MGERWIERGGERERERERERECVCVCERDCVQTREAKTIKTIVRSRFRTRTKETIRIRIGKGR